MATKAEPVNGHGAEHPSHTREAEGELAQAFKDVTRGEKTATAMEQQLTKLESKIDDLLATAEEQNHDSAARMLSGGQKIVGEEAGE